MSDFKGFVRAFPPEYISGFSSGTGLAGIYGTLYYLLASNLVTYYNMNSIYVISFILLDNIIRFFYFKSQLR
jgi:hypothetical protein